MARQISFTDEQIIECAKTLQANGRDVTPNLIKSTLGGGNFGRIRQIWMNYLENNKEEPIVVNIPEIPLELEELQNEVIRSFVEDFLPRLKSIFPSTWSLSSEIMQKRLHVQQREVIEKEEVFKRELNNAIDAVTAEENKFNELNTYFDELTLAYNASQNDLASLKSHAEHLFAELEQLRAENASLKDQNSRVSNDNKAFELLLSATTAKEKYVSEELENAKTLNARLFDDVQSLTLDLNSSNSKVAILESSHLTLREEIFSLNKRVSILQDENNSLNASCASSRSLVEQLQLHNATLSADRTQLRTDATALTDKFNTAFSKQATLESELRSAEQLRLQLVQTKDDEINRLYREKALIQELANKLTTDNANLSSSVSCAKRDYDALLSDFNVQSNAIKDLESQINISSSAIVR